MPNGWLRFVALYVAALPVRVLGLHMSGHRSVGAGGHAGAGAGVARPRRRHARNRCAGSCSACIAANTNLNDLQLCYHTENCSIVTVNASGSDEEVERQSSFMRRSGRFTSCQSGEPRGPPDFLILRGDMATTRGAMGLHNRSKHNNHGFPVYWNGFTWVYHNKARWAIGLRPDDGLNWLQSERNQEPNPARSPHWEMKINHAHNKHHWAVCYSFSIISIALPYNPYNSGEHNGHQVDPWP
mmetsp:Transcript_83809/g.237693  ORF Transcript_83809/g.237693 Transcript_83809/m.237693 type:complete len:241 (+) Transcript_83809:38-760(+)